ncbi:hypothetical protein EXS72_00275 [Candidatus Pacearchaeota archaeon]|nr:hypothetical protein [Candidatus Pacearchaeota archaeon]
MIGRLRNEFHRMYSRFAKSESYQAIKRVRLVRNAKITFGKMLWKFAPYKFPLHGDVISMRLFKEIVEHFQIDTIVETGTFRGYTTELLAKMFPKIKIYTCEINDFNYKHAKKNLSKYKNVHVFKGTSPKFLTYLINNKLIGENTLFYLDAHWLDDWPLEEELKIISTRLENAIAIIDDFKVPENNIFAFDKYGSKECALPMVINSISPVNKYNLLFPNYGNEIFNKDIAHPPLVGYVTLFQNLNKEYTSFCTKEFIKKFFKISNIFNKQINLKEKNSKRKKINKK